MDLPFYREYNLPWAGNSGQERKFRRLLGMTFAVMFVLGALWPFIPTPDIDPNEVDEIPPRIAKLLLERKPPPPPPKPKEPEPEEAPIEEPEPEKVVEEEPEPVPEPEPEPEPDLEQVARQHQH